MVAASWMRRHKTVLHIMVWVGVVVAYCAVMQTYEVDGPIDRMFAIPPLAKWSVLSFIITLVFIDI